MVGFFIGVGQEWIFGFVWSVFIYLLIYYCPTVSLNVIISVLFGFSYLQNMPILTEERKEDFNCFENLMTKEFIGQQLILIIGCMDTMEEGGR